MPNFKKWIIINFLKCTKEKFRLFRPILPLRQYNFSAVVFIPITRVKGHEPKLYEALWVIVGLFFNFTIVKKKGPKKPLKKNLGTIVP